MPLYNLYSIVVHSAAWNRYSQLMLGLWCGWRLVCSQTMPAYGQTLGVYTDDTTQTILEGSADCSNDCTITGSSLLGDGLFHSFREFSIPENTTVTFADGGAANIFARVSGEHVSTLNGTLAVSGNADLFLLNPQGIIFGPDAALEIPGSFLASSAQSILFANDTRFGTADPSVPLLSVSTPIGLQFGSQAHPIVNRSQSSLNGALNQDLQPAGLRVLPGKALALLGGDVFLEGGNLTANGGRVSLGSVGANSTVALLPEFAFGYEQVSTFGDVLLTHGAQIDVSGSGGDVSVHSHNLYMADSSSITNYVLGLALPGTISLIAEDAIELNNSGIVFPHYFSVLKEGSQLDIVANRFALRNGSIVLGVALGAFGGGAQITISAADSIELTGANPTTPNYITASSIAGDGAGGDIVVNTRRLLVADGSQLESVTGGAGQGGDITINASERVDVVGKAPTSTASAAERVLLALGLQFDSTAMGQPSVSRIVATSGVEEVDSSGVTGPGGALTIRTDTLSIAEGAQVSVGSFSSADSGDLLLNARAVRLDTGAQISAATTAAGDGGNIRLSGLKTLVLRRGSTISTSAATGDELGDGGNISIDADFVVALPLEDSDIIANSTQGRGGNIDISTLGLYGIAPRRALSGNGTSDIDASSEFGISGTTAVNRTVTTPALSETALATQTLNVSTAVTQRCGASGNRFVVSARGGIPLTPTDAMEAHSVMVDLGAEGVDDNDVNLSAGERLFVSPDVTGDRTLAEANGWQTDADGQVVLMAQRSHSESFSSLATQSLATQCSG